MIALARAPSEEAWERLLRFAPDDVLYLRVRAAVQILMRLGVDPRLPFGFATNDGVVPDAIEMVQEGLIAPEIVLERAERGSRASYALWVGLAAEAALAQGRREDVAEPS